MNQLLMEILQASDIQESEPLSPEKKLVIALLERAFLDLSSSDDRWQEDAYRWIYDLEDGPLTFPTCCEFLNLDPEMVQIALEDMADEGRKFTDTRMRIK